MDQILKIVLDALSQFLQTVLSGVLPIIAIAAASWVVALAKQAWQKVKVEHTATAETLEAIAKIAVNAAEQYAIAGKIELDKRKDYACEVVENYAAKLGLTVDMNSIYAAVEAAVKTEFNLEKTATPNKATTG